MPPDVILFLEHRMKSSVMVNGSPGSSILIESILSHAEVLRTWGHTQASIVAAVHEKGLRSRLCCDDGQWLRLRDETEQLREVVEDVLKLQLVANDMSLIDMMNQELVSHWLTVFGAELARDRLQRVKEAVMTSQKLELTGARIAPRNFLPSGPMHSQSDEPAWISTPSVVFGFCFNEDAGNQLPVYDPQWQGMQTPMMIPMPSEPDSSYLMEERYMGDTQYTTGQRRKRSGREFIVDAVVQILQQNANDWAEDGSMSLAAVFEQSYWMTHRCTGEIDLARLLLSNGEASPLVVDYYARRVRFRTFSEQLVGLCEMLLTQTNGTILTLSIAVNTPLLQSHFAAEGNSVNEMDQVEMLRFALEYAEIIQVMPSSEGGSSDFVAWRSTAEILVGTVERALTQSAEVVCLMKKEGEVPLAMLAEEHVVCHMLDRAGITSSKDILPGLQSAIVASNHFELDMPRLSCRPKGEPGKLPSQLSQDEDAGQEWKKTLPRGHLGVGSYLVPRDKDVQALRKFLQHYFQPFNLQHNRVFISLQAQFRRLRATAKDRPPYYTLKDICQMPRIRELCSRYSFDGLNNLLAAAFDFEDHEEMPLQLCHEAHGPKGMCAQWQLWLELSYVPQFRYFQEAQPCKEVQLLLEPPIDEGNRQQALSPNSFLVMSYSISSDLSHSRSSKAEELFEATARGDLDPSALFFENRLLKLKRQLLWYAADIICVQGIQCIGTAERCSETDPRWFRCDNDPPMNHLAFLYRELARQNYGVVFMPTLPQPWGQHMSFGNAVFWKRTRWQLERHWAVSSALCVELSSRLEGPDVLVCCSRAEMVYHEEWGTSSHSNEELMSGLLPVHRELMNHASRRELRPIWCGDFGLMNSDAVMTELAKDEMTPMHRWRSSSKSVLGHDPWSSLARFTAGRATDLILHDQSLQPIAVLNGLPMECQGKSTFLELLQSGYPSDHLIQMAAFMDSNQQPSPLTNSPEANTARPPLRQRNDSAGKAPARSKMQRVERGRWRSWQDLIKHQLQ